MLEDMARRRPWLTPCEQVAQLKDKGVTFNLWSESDAVDYLRKHNNYFRVRSYRSNFPKCVGGKNDGKMTCGLATRHTGRNMRLNVLSLKLASRKMRGRVSLAMSACSVLQQRYTCISLFSR